MNSENAEPSTPVHAHCSSPIEVVKEFTAGYVAGIGNDPCRIRFREVDHWIAGWIAGWEAGRKDRPVKNAAIDAYLVSVGLPPQNMVSVV